MSDFSIEPILQRIKVLRNCFRWTENSIAGGNSAAQMRLNRQLSHGAGLKVETLLRVLDACPGVSCEWLIRGAGEMLLETAGADASGSRNACDNNNVSVKANDNASVSVSGTGDGRDSGATIARLLDLLAEKDRQINTLLAIIAK